MSPADFSHGRMCSKCHQVLNEWEEVGGKSLGFHHPNPDQERRCNPFLALPADASALVGFCDFCSTPVPERTAVVRCRPFLTAYLDAETMELAPAPIIGDDGQWSACEVCADLIGAGQWGDLLRHSIYCFERKHGTVTDEHRKEMVRDIGGLHNAIRLGFIGLERP